MIAWGGTRLALGHPLRAESAGYQIRAARQFGGLALVCLLALALVSQCTCARARRAA